MSGSAKTIILGNIGSVPAERLRYMGGAEDSTEAIAVCTVGIGVDGRRQGAPTEWYECTFFGKQAELLVAHFQKGDGIFLETVRQTRSYQDKTTGEQRTKVEYVVDRLSFLPGSRKSAAISDQAASQSVQGVQNTRPVTQQRPVVRASSIPQPIYSGQAQGVGSVGSTGGTNTTRMRAQALAAAAQASRAEVQAPIDEFESDPLFAPEDDFTDQ